MKVICDLLDSILAAVLLECIGMKLKFWNARYITCHLVLYFMFCRASLALLLHNNQKLRNSRIKCNAMLYSPNLFFESAWPIDVILGEGCTHWLCIVCNNVKPSQCQSVSHTVTTFARAKVLLYHIAFTAPFFFLKRCKWKVVWLCTTAF